MVAVNEGLQPGDRVVTEGTDRLHARGRGACRHHAGVQVSRDHREPVAPVHPPPRRHHAGDGGNPDRRFHRLPDAAGVGAARGGLPDDPGGDAVPRGQSGCHDLAGHVAVGAAVRADAGLEPDVVHQFGRRLGHHDAVQPDAAAGRGRAAGAGGDQRRVEPAAQRLAGAADLQQGEPGGRGRADAGHHIAHHALAAGARSGGYAGGAEVVADSRRGPGQRGGRPAAGGAGAGQSAGAGGQRSGAV
ncbi:hypothetical protein G6F57_017162 [Rhizopus arrhizus]|nr:hypothetical protein G6F57_017162 [Rhizopus arrhizus]